MKNRTVIHAFPTFPAIQKKICFFNFDVKCALSGNRTPVSRVAGENSTTEPTMLAKLVD